LMRCRSDQAVVVCAPKDSKAQPLGLPKDTWHCAKELAASVRSYH